MLRFERTENVLRQALVSLHPQLKNSCNETKGKESSLQFTKKKLQFTISFHCILCSLLQSTMSSCREGGYDSSINGLVFRMNVS